MIQLKDLGTFESVPHIVTDIVTGNISACYVLLAKYSMVSGEWR